MKVIQRAEFGKLFELLRDNGYTVVGPTVRDNAIIYDELESVSDLPEGITDDQEAGHYRLKKRTDKALFGYVVGPHSWKKYMFPAKLKLWEADKDGRQFEIKENHEAIKKYAFIGIRSCELKAVFIQDKVFNNGTFADSYYNRVRKNVLFVAVNCTEAGGTCFCVSMNTGPKATYGFDLSLTEIINEKEHYFVLTEGSPKGKELVSNLKTDEATDNEVKLANDAIKNAADNMGRQIDTKGIKELLLGNLEHPRWNEVASRCLTCANCTLVCPTCFCSNVEDLTDLKGDHTERWRRWDSCFTMEFSKVAGGNFRTSPKARYRQWMTHKLASWQDQFGTSGCVGCGRCITWCPVGIDITQEAEFIRNNLQTKL
jgi:formate hydrogenlyase subunit 6/NADH:ubiquinone oxidoreductase subunit I